MSKSFFPFCYKAIPGLFIRDDMFKTAFFLLFLCFLGAATSDDHLCDQPIDVGPCFAEIRSWAFDAEQGKCVQFIYGGCEGNSNNFETEEECKFACKFRRI